MRSTDNSDNLSVSARGFRRVEELLSAEKTKPLDTKRSTDLQHFSERRISINSD